MGIMLEAYEAHMIEQNERHSKYYKKYEKEIKEKAEKWSSIHKSFESGNSLSNNDFLFLIKESRFMFDSILVDTFPYLKDHLKRIVKEQEYKQLMEHYFAVMPTFREFLQNGIYLSTSSLFSKRRLGKVIETANHLLEKYAAEIELITAFHNNQEITILERQNNKSLIYELEKKLSRKEDIDKDSIQWLIDFSGTSINEQYKTSELFFEHHFTRVRRSESMYKNIEAFEKVFSKIHKFIVYVSTQRTYLFGNHDYLERIKREAEDIKYNDYKGNYLHRVDRILREHKVKMIQEAKRLKETDNEDDD